MRKFLALLALTAALGTGAASADTIVNAQGNTIVVTYANGAVARYHFSADNTFSATLPDGAVISGIWNIANGEVCFLPNEGGARSCTPYVADKAVGDTWQQVGADGSPITVTLQAGR
jgi:hypothetical protein